MTEPSPGFWPFKVEIKVPWRDIDGAGHVNNAVYFSYMETARAECYLKMRGGERFQDLDIILARATCDYRSPAFFHEVLVVEVHPVRVGATSITLGYAIREKTTGRLVAEGESVLVCFDYENQAKRAVPEPVRAYLEAGLKSGQ